MNNLENICKNILAESQQDNEVWKHAQTEELNYWGNCYNYRTWCEFSKGEMYAREIGLTAEYGVEGELNMQGKSVIDIGGGPVSMTLRCFNSRQLTVVDPCNWPPSVQRRYDRYGIKLIKMPAESLTPDIVGVAEEAWLINLLQHVQDPALVIERCKCMAKVIRIFDWLNIPPDGGAHPRMLTAEGILNWFLGCKIRQIRLPRINEYWSNADAIGAVFETGL